MFDPYYETKVNPRWGRLPIGKILGGLLVSIGILDVVFTICDLSTGMTSVNNSAWQENSIWPTIGKGIWVGAILIANGVIGYISNRERTQVSLYMFNGLSWVSAVFSLYLMISSILHVQPYLIQSSQFTSPVNRNTPQTLEILWNSLLMATGSIGFILAITAAALSCLAGNCCINRQKYEPFKNIVYGPGIQQSMPQVVQQITSN